MKKAPGPDEGFRRLLLARREKNGPRREPQTVSQPNQISEDQSEIFKRIREPLDQSGLPTQKRG
jgi:hypothetical protein